MVKKEKINYSCLCGLNFGNKKDNYIRHINKKNPCVVPKSKELPQNLPQNLPQKLPQNIPSCIKIKPINNEIETKNKFNCPFCFQNFVKKYGLNRHLDNRCKIK